MNAWKTYTQDTIQQVMDFSQGYIDFLSYAKTERLAASRMEEMAIQAGYIDIEEVIEKKITLKPQDKVYIKYMNKSLCLMHIGNEPLEKGLNILGAHIDSPRLDLKQHPLYEDSNIAYFDTHYYGGVKKYRNHSFGYPWRHLFKKWRNDFFIYWRRGKRSCLCD